MRNSKLLKIMMTLSFIVIMIPALLISGCVNKEDRLVSSGKTVIVQQGKDFCLEHPEDSICTD